MLHVLMNSFSELIAWNLLTSARSEGDLSFTLFVPACTMMMSDLSLPSTLFFISSIFIPGLNLTLTVL